MKKILFLLLFACLTITVGAQDARQRNTATIVADGLAQLPAQTLKVYNNTIQELAATGAEGIRIMADMLVPADKGKNATIEYALNGVVSFVTGEGQENLAPGVRTGLVEAIGQCKDKANQAFLLTLLKLCATETEIPVFVRYATDDYLADYAIRGMISTPGSDQALLDLLTGSDPDILLAYAAGAKKIATAEPVLLQWAQEPSLSDSTKRAVYDALSKCGTSASVKTLAAAAKAADYGPEETEATAAYVNLLNTLAAQGDAKTAIAKAKSLQRATNRSHVRAAALGIILQADPESQTSNLLAALRDKDRQYRNAALDFARAFADETLYTAIAKKMKSLSNEAKTDVVNWLGSQHAVTQIDVILSTIDSPNQELATAAIRAAGKIGGQEALEALIAQLGGAHAKDATAALRAFNGKINEGVITALDADPVTQTNALKLVAQRRMSAASGKVFTLLEDDNQEVQDAAYEALAGVTTVNDFDKLCDLLDAADNSHVKQLQNGLKNALAGQDAATQYKMVARRMAAASDQTVRYYPLLAQAGNQDAIDALLEAFNGTDREAAFDALLQVNNPVMIDVLYTVACQHPAQANAALSRYTDFVTASAETNVQKYQLYRRALEVKSSAKTQNKLLKALAQTAIFPALAIAAQYMDQAETAEMAAYAVKFIAGKNPDLGGKIVADALRKAQKVYADLAKSDPDAGYAVDEIKGMLAKLPASGYVSVFDGTLDGWEAVVGNPESRATMPSRDLAAKTELAEKSMAKNWNATGQSITGMAHGGAIGTTRNYENFELFIDWKTEGKAGLGIRSIPQIGLGGRMSGTLTGNKVYTENNSATAANQPGKWNTIYVKVVNDRVTIILNGVTVTDNTILENSCNREIPAYTSGQIQLIAGDAPVEFRNLYIHELPPTPRFELSEEEVAEGFEVLFDGTSMHKWTGNTTDYIPVDGTIYVSAQFGGKGNLYTKKEYSNFILRFEFAFMREGVNNGVGIRTPMGVDAAYHGMEIQILDHDAPIYKKLRIYQQHGSVYGIIPAKRIKFPPLGQWNTEEIRAEGDHITVTVNGEVILDGNIREACQGHNVSEDGSRTNPYTIDHKNHPGLFNKSGHIGFLGHGEGIKFRNIRIKELPETSEEE